MDDYLSRYERIQKLKTQYGSKKKHSSAALITMAAVGVFWGIVIMAGVRYFDRPAPVVSAMDFTPCNKCHARVAAYLQQPVHDPLMLTGLPQCRRSTL